MLISRQILELGTHFVGRNNCIFTSCSIQSLSGTQDTHTANLRFYWHKWKYFSRILVMISLAECQAQDWFKFCIKMACVLVVLGGQQPVSNLDVTKTFLLCHFVRNSYPVIQKDRNLGASNWWSSRLTHKSKFFFIYVPDSFDLHAIWWPSKFWRKWCWGSNFSCGICQSILHKAAKKSINSDVSSGKEVKFPNANNSLYSLQ
jgi:hypothetical protein